LRELDRRSRNNQRRETRRHAPLDVLDKGREPCTGSGDDPAAIFETKETLRALGKAVGALSFEQRRLIYKIFVEDTALSHIARDEGVSKAAVTQRVKRILKNLRKLLE
jgi:DNA-directed RNA polymerase specialized sigma24 family protein